MMFRRRPLPEISETEKAVDAAKKEAACKLDERKSLLQEALRRLGGSIEVSTDELIDALERGGDE